MERQTLGFKDFKNFLKKISCALSLNLCVYLKSDSSFENHSNECIAEKQLNGTNTTNNIVF